MFKNIIKVLAQILCRFIIFVLGWHSLDKQVVSRLQKNPRTVLVFSHTSYCDFYIMLLYKIAFSSDLYDVKVIVKPEPFKYAGPFLRALGAIPAGSVENKNSGTTQAIVEELRKYQHFCLLISPKGSIDKKPWRLGYYHIAKELQIPIMVVGLDYEKKKVWISLDYIMDQDEEIIRKYLYKELAEIVPLFPADEVVEIRPHDQKKRNVISGWRLIIIFVVSSILYRKIF